MVRWKDLPIYDANGVKLHIGDTILHGMRTGDPTGWDEVIIVEANMGDEILGQDPVTGERGELAGQAHLRGLVKRPHKKQGAS